MIYRALLFMAAILIFKCTEGAGVGIIHVALVGGGGGGGGEARKIEGL